MATIADGGQVGFLVKLLQFFDWTRVAVMHDENDANAIVMADLFVANFTDASPEYYIKRTSYSSSSNDAVLSSMLKSLLSDELTVFLLFPGNDRGVSVLSVACDDSLGIGEGFVWIATDM